MQIAAVCFVLAALGGLTIATMRLRGTSRPPTWMALGHGLIGITGLAILGSAVLSTSLLQMGALSFGLFVLAALGGATMFLFFHLRERPLPILLMLGHGATAAIVLILLLVTILR